MAIEELGVETASANARISINEATLELLNDALVDFQAAKTLIEAVDHFLDDSQGFIGPCAGEKSPENAADANLHAMVALELLRKQLAETELKIEGACAACVKAKGRVQ